MVTERRKHDADHPMRTHREQTTSCTHLARGYQALRRVLLIFEQQRRTAQRQRPDVVRVAQEKGLRVGLWVVHDAHRGGKVHHVAVAVDVQVLARDLLACGEYGSTARQVEKRLTRPRKRQRSKILNPLEVEISKSTHSFSQTMPKRGMLLTPAEQQS